MRFTIKKGKHFARPRKLGIFYNKKEVSAWVVFEESCRYYLAGEDFGDTNKLFGLGYLWNIHDDSARFGWRYDINGMVLISAYVYIDGVRIIEDLHHVEIGEPVELSIFITQGEYCFNIDGTEVTCIPFNHKKRFSFPCGLYFGGNKTAPQNITVDIKRL